MNQQIDNFYKITKIIDILLNKEFSIQIENELFNLINNKSNFINYFLKNVQSIYWFYSLKKRNYFSSETAPGPQPSEQESFTIIPQWNVLPYLEKVSQQVNEPENEKYINELLEIIKDVSNYKDSEGKPIDNYRTWWFFVKILSNIPTEKIPKKVIDLIPNWLDSKFDTSLVGSEILKKLLPKFLSEESSIDDIKKAEKIVKYTTVIKKVSDKKTGLSESSKYKTVIDSYYLIEAFKKYSHIIGEKCSKEVISDLSEKVKVLLKIYEYKTPITINDNTYLLILKEVEKDYVVKVLKIKDKTEMDVLGKIFEGEEIKGDEVTEIKLMKNDRISFMEETFQSLIKKLNISSPEQKDPLKKKLKNLYNNYHNSGTYSSFYEEKEYLDRDPLEVLTFILKSVLIAKAKSPSQKNIDETKEIISTFLQENYLFFPKMAFYVIGHDTDRYAHLFWEALKKDTDDAILDDILYGDELKHLLSNLKSLTEEQRELLKQKIDNAVKEYEEEESDKVYIACLKQKWYEALSFDPEFKMRYEEMMKITKRDEQLGPAVGPVVTTWVGPGASALSKEEMLKMPNGELAEFLNTFKGKDLWEDRPTVRGLGEMLKQAVQDKPEKFVNDLNPFLKIGYLYMFYILWGLRDAYVNNKDFNWQKFFVFIKEYLKQEEFWKNELPIVGERGWNPEHKSIVGEIARLIQEGVKDDTRTLPDAFLEDASQILWLIFERFEPYTEKEMMRDYVTNALNSPWGKVISAFITLVIRIVRADEKKGVKKDIKGEDAYREKYNFLLEKGIIDAYTWFGYYLPQFHYIDKKWAKEKVNYLEKQKGNEIWEAFMNGYLYTGKVYDDIYELMRPHYEWGIYHDFKNSHDKERVIQHISLGYLRGKESLEESESLFKKILDRGNHEQIKEIINFFWMKRDYAALKNEESENIKQKITEFWRWMFEHYKDKESEQFEKNDKELLSELSELTVFLDEIDDEKYQWLMLTADYVHEGFKSPFFIEFLNNLKDRGDKEKTAGFLADIFLKMLDKFTPDYDSSHIRSIVEFLYNAGQKERANNICNIYGSRGYEFLREIYYNKNKDT